MSGNNPKAIQKSEPQSTQSRSKSLWCSWAPESLSRAQSEHKPIFLLLIHDSYWSRVAQRRFSRPSPLRDLVATSYVPILAHVEDHPEVNAFFAKFIKLSTGTVGWPMLLWLTPTGSPIMGSVYLPFEEKTPYFRVGLFGCLQVIARYWDDPRWRETNAQPMSWINTLSRLDGDRTTPATRDAWMSTYASRWIKRFDPYWGGFSGAPKFPLSSVLSGLLGVWNAHGEEACLEVVEYTLEKKLTGGIYDHIGGGIFRYSLDRQWRSSCFEKTLSDNCELAQILLSLYRITEHESYAHTVREIIDALLRDFKKGGQGFIARVGLDDQGVSNLSTSLFHYYSWSQEEARSVLTPDEADWFIQSFSINQMASPLERHHESDRRIPRLDYPLNSEEYAYWSTLRTRLYLARKQRFKIYTSTKQICTYNALAITVLAKAAMILNEPLWLTQAQQVAQFLCSALWDGQRLSRSYHQRQVSQEEGCLEDYMSLSYALSVLYDCTEDLYFANLSELIFERGHALFKDHRCGGYFQAIKHRRELLPVPEKPILDGIETSGNAWALLALMKLYQRERSSFYLSETESLLDLIIQARDLAPGSTSSIVNALSIWSAQGRSTR